MGYNLITSIAFAFIGKQQTREIVALTTDNLMGLIFSAYSRHDEYEADRLGGKYLHLAGYDVNGMIKILETLKEEESKGFKFPLVLLSHPYLEDRLAAVRREIAVYYSQ